MTDQRYDWSWSKKDHGRVPPEADVTRPSVARGYDYLLGGKNNYPVDREAAEQLLALAPSTRAVAVNNRRFLGRAVRHVARDEGIRQFLDHGSGLPTQENVHQIAQRIDPGCRVVYVDKDPVVLAHGRALLADNPRTSVITADMRDTRHPRPPRRAAVVRPRQAHGLPVRLRAALHPRRGRPGRPRGRVMDRAAPGSCLILSHLVSDDPGVRTRLTDFMLAATGGDWGRVRTVEEVAGWFEGLDLLSPGLVEASRWRPDPGDRPQDTLEWIEFVGVARKPAS